MSARETLANEVRAAIRDVPDFPKPGILFRDITTVLCNGPLFGRVCDHLTELAKDCKADCVAGIESRGFVFAAPVAARLRLPLVLFRKPGKLPYRTRKASYSLEYGTDTIEVHEDAIRPSQRVLVVDDLLATGGTMSAACQLIREAGGVVALVAFVIELSELNGRDRLKGLPVDTLVVY